MAPVLHTLPFAADEVRVTEPPWQKVIGPDAEMVGVPAETVTEIVLVTPAPQVFEAVKDSVYTPAVVQVTLAVAPLAAKVPPPDNSHVYVVLGSTALTL